MPYSFRANNHRAPKPAASRATFRHTRCRAMISSSSVSLEI
jgi:hypothetical protein